MTDIPQDPVSRACAPQVPCPQCRQPSVFAPSNPWRPFCSQRCRQIDLGAWASESFRIPASPAAPGDTDAQEPEA